MASDADRGESGRPHAEVPDDREFARLFAEQAPRVARVLRRMGVRERDVEDVLQEVFVVLHQRWEEFRGESSLSTWVYGIALRKAMGHRRLKHVRDEVAFSEYNLPSQPPDQHGRLQQLQRREVLGAALSRLDDRKREVFVLFELEHVPMKEVASIVDAPLHTCYSRLQAARAELKQQLSRLAKRGGLP